MKILSTSIGSPEPGIHLYGKEFEAEDVIKIWYTEGGIKKCFSRPLMEVMTGITMPQNVDCHEIYKDGKFYPFPTEYYAKIEKENSNLKKENEALKKQVKELELSHNVLRSNGYSGPESALENIRALEAICDHYKELREERINYNGKSLSMIEFGDELLKENEALKQQIRDITNEASNKNVNIRLEELEGNNKDKRIRETHAILHISRGTLHLSIPLDFSLIRQMEYHMRMILCRSLDEGLVDKEWVA